MSAPVTLRLPPWVETLDEGVDRAWGALRSSPALDRLFYAASAAGDFSAVWHVANLALVASGAQSRRNAAKVAAALALDSLLVNQGIKRLFERRRPDPDGDRPHHLRQPSTSSFPSGHASSATVAASLLSRTGVGTLGSALIRTTAAVVATSRIHVRIHHASDVIAGAAVGFVFARAAQRLW